MADIKALREKCEKWGQGHLVKFWDTLEESQQTALLGEINGIDLEEVCGYFSEADASMRADTEKIDEQLEPLEKEVCGSVARSSNEELEDYRIKGLTAIGNSEVAVLLLAGGQGTRLGVPYPKGMYDVGLPSGRTLYQIQAERVLRLQRMGEKLTGKPCTIPWYIMTSEHTKEATEKFFTKNDFFGLKKENMVLFEQGLLPCFDFDGKIIMDSPSKIAQAPDGNGGLYNALRNEKVLDDLSRRGVRHIHVYCVDNILVKMADPTFIGFCISKNVECGAKAVEKTQPNEAVGVVCKVAGKYKVVEYSEITTSTSEKRGADGRLAFNQGNICNHYFTLDFLKHVCVKENSAQLKHHVAKKKIPYVDTQGKQHKPSAPNGIKMEKFVFDVFHFAQNFGVWEVLREEEFSPLKNADGASNGTPTTCRQDLQAQHRRFLTAAGGALTGSQDDAVCEISALVSYAGEDLESVVSGKKFKSPVRVELQSDGSVGVTQGQ